jgi:hypothetical protein
MTASPFLIPICLISIFNLLSCSQQLTVPHERFRIVADDSITIEKGASKKLKITVLRANDFVNKNVRMEISSLLPQSVAISFDPAINESKVSRAIIHVSTSAKAGSYFVVLSGSVEADTKGRVLKLIIPESAASIMHRPPNNN